MELILHSSGGLSSTKEPRIIFLPVLQVVLAFRKTFRTRTALFCKNVTFLKYIGWCLGSFVPLIWLTRHTELSSLSFPLLLLIISPLFQDFFALLSYLWSEHESTCRWLIVHHLVLLLEIPTCLSLVFGKEADPGSPCSFLGTPMHEICVWMCMCVLINRMEDMNLFLMEDEDFAEVPSV